MDQNNEMASRQQNKNNDDINLSPLFEYLKTENGNQIANRMLTIIDDVKKATLTQSSKNMKLAVWQQIIIVGIVIIAATILITLDKFSPTVGVLFGTLIGYVFGKK